MFLPCKKCVPLARQNLPLCPACIKAKEFHDLELLDLRDELREGKPMQGAQIPDKMRPVAAHWLAFDQVSRSAPLTDFATAELANVFTKAEDILQGFQVLGEVPERLPEFAENIGQFVKGEQWQILRNLSLCPSSTGRISGDPDDRLSFSDVIGTIGAAYKLAKDLGALPAPKENPTIPEPCAQEATFAEREFRRVFALADKALADLHNCPRDSRRYRRAVRLIQKPEFAAWIAMLQEVVQSIHGVAPLSAVDFRSGPCETRRESPFAGEQRRQRESADRTYLGARRKAPCTAPKASIASASGDNGRVEYARLDAASRAKLAAWRANAK